MIYALVEPSIYMIASILPTTRHLYRRIRNKALLTAQMRSAKSNSAPETSNNSRSAGSERGGNSVGLEGGGGVQPTDSWPGQRHSSQEELTIGLGSEEVKTEGAAPKAKPPPVVRKKVEVRDRGRAVV